MALGTYEEIARDILVAFFAGESAKLIISNVQAKDLPQWAGEAYRTIFAAVKTAGEELRTRPGRS
jgi:hypothetical protein